MALLLLAAVGAGCRGPSPRTSADWVADADRIERVERVGRALLPGGDIDWGVSPRDGLGAWAWPDGRIVVSQALVDRLDDDELAAALAHEIGHLLDGGHLATVPLALRGDTRDGDLELRADRTGCELLASRGRPLEAMSRMLAKVAAGHGDGGGAFRRRIAAADAACRPGATAR
jgi:Zn-dependent protease with chaperone function